MDILGCCIIKFYRKKFQDESEIIYRDVKYFNLESKIQIYFDNFWFFKVKDIIVINGDL